MALPDYVVRGSNAANELRLSLDLGLEPLKDLWGLVRGIDDAALAFHGFGRDGPDGVYHWNGTRGLIVVNRDKLPIARQRFTAAHELGHHLLHREGKASLVIPEGDLQAPSKGKHRIEKEADAFAGYLLAPTQAMARAFSGKPSSQVSAEDIADLMHEFGTTFQMTVYRLHNSGRIKASDRDRILADGNGRVNAILSAKGFDREEFPSGFLPPDYMLKAVGMYEGGAIELPALARLLRTDETEAAKLVGRGQAPEGDVEPALDGLDAEIDRAFGGEGVSR